MLNYRVLVTGHNEKDESQIVSIEPIRVDNTFTYQPGFSVEIFWKTPKNVTVGGEFESTASDSSSILPEPSGTTAMIITFPPAANNESPEAVDFENLIKEMFERLPGLAEKFEPDSPGFHRTDTVDYVVLLEGELRLLLDNDESADLTVGDVIIQNGTRHAWNNVSNSDARVLVVMVGATRKN